MQAARTNVASVHYHFGSKERLLEAVLRSRVDQVARERDAVLLKLPDGEVAAHDLARAFVQPVVVVLGSGGEHWIRLVGHLLATGDEGLSAISTSFFLATLPSSNFWGSCARASRPRHSTSA